ncbi:MAG: hypothetical protein ACM3VZ_15525 [Acidobacteriota bacterium]
MKNFNYLHLSGLSAVGLVVACLAQQWFGEHRSYGHTATAYQASSETIETAQAAHREASARLALIRDDRQQEQSRKAQQQLERVKRERAWQAFYVQPAACQNPATNRLFTACADDHIRARREFEQAYAANPIAIQPFRSAVATNEE